MNAAEITDKLGLHSLRQRAWVCIRSVYGSCVLADRFSSTSNPPVLLPAMVSTKGWNG